MQKPYTGLPCKECGAIIEDDVPRHIQACARCDLITDWPRAEHQYEPDIGQCLNCAREEVPLTDGLCRACYRADERHIEEEYERLGQR